MFAKCETLNEVTGRVVTELESFGLSDAQIRDAIHTLSDLLPLSVKS